MTGNGLGYLGGGIVKGSLILVGGDPGIGKSTLILQLCQSANIGSKIVYVSGEGICKADKDDERNDSV